MQRFAVVVSALALTLTMAGSALAQDPPNQGEEGKVLTVDNPAVSCGTPTASAKVDGVNSATIEFSSSLPIDKVTVKSGEQAEVVSSSFAADNLSGSITLSQNVSNYVVWTCAAASVGGNPPPPPTPPSGGGSEGAGGGGGGSLGGEAAGGGEGALPFTGLPFAVLGLAGLALLLGGLGLMRSGRTQ